MGDHGDAGWKDLRAPAPPDHGMEQSHTLNGVVCGAADADCGWRRRRNAAPLIPDEFEVPTSWAAAGKLGQD